MAYTKSIVKKEDSSSIVYDYKTKDFPLVQSPSATEFVAQGGGLPSQFQISPYVAQKAGIAKLQKDSLDARIEEAALQQIKQVQERAYKEAYDLGLIEGAENAFKAKQQELEGQLNHLAGLLAELENMKEKIVADHEAHIVRLIYNLASRIALKEIKNDPESILPVVKKVVKDTQSDEHLVVRVAPEDLQFLDHSKEKLGRVGEMLRRVRMEATEGISPGGCLLESNYGSIDATIEMRVARAWEALAEGLPSTGQRTPGGEGDHGPKS